MMIDTGDVLIVGAGPVGLLTALALAQKGISVTVVEAAEGVSDAPRAMVYFAPTMIALHELGLLDDVARQSVEGRAFGHHVPDFGVHLKIENSVMAGITFDYQLHCGQDIVARIAQQHAERLGVRVLFNHKLVALTQNADSAIATVQTPDGARDLRAKWIIGADGARSTVRQLLDIEFAGHTWGNRFVATNVYCDFSTLGYQAANFVCDPTYSAVIAVIDNKGLWRLTYQEDGTLPVDSFMERLPERYGFFIPQGTPFEIASANPYTIHQRCATTLRQGRILLAGDAAHATNPCGGLGLTTGLWSGMILSDTLAAVLQEDADEALLDRYSEERRRIFHEVTSPAASRNKRMLEESDPDQRRQDLAMVEAAAADPAVARIMLSFPFKVIGDTLRPDSRWAHIDPTGPAGIDISARKSQLA